MFVVSVSVGSSLEGTDLVVDSFEGSGGDWLVVRMAWRLARGPNGTVVAGCARTLSRDQAAGLGNLGRPQVDLVGLAALDYEMFSPPW